MKVQRNKHLYYLVVAVFVVFLYNLSGLSVFTTRKLQGSEAELSDDLEGDEEESDGTFLYFAYASDLLQSRLHAGGGPSAKFVGIGRVKGRKFAFSQESKVWRGGVADIVPAEKGEVWGVVYRLKDTDLPTLNKQKGTEKADPLYERINVKVDLQGSQASVVGAISYDIVESKRLPFGAAPSPQYKECLLRGAEEQGLPASYIESLKGIKDNGSTYRRKNVC